MPLPAWSLSVAKNSTFENSSRVNETHPHPWGPNELLNIFKYLEISSRNLPQNGNINFQLIQWDFFIFYFRNTETLIHLLKGSLGTGILAMPNAFYNSGYVTGVIATIIIGFLCTYCLHVLVRAQYELCKRLRVPCLSYPMSMKYALEQGPHSIRWFAPYAP